MSEENVRFVEQHYDADQIIVEKRTGRIVGAVYRTPYGRRLGVLRAFIYAVGAVSVEDEALAALDELEEK